jgi:hypothetical protein
MGRRDEGSDPFERLRGRTVLVEITCRAPGGALADRFHAFGRIEVANETWIGIRRNGWAELFGLPPAPELFEPAAEGVYTLEANGEQVEPDLLATFEVAVVDEESVLTIRGVGFVPAGR